MSETTAYVPRPKDTDQDRLRWALGEIERLYGIAQRLLTAFPTAQTYEQEKVWQEAYDALMETK